MVFDDEENGMGEFVEVAFVNERRFLMVDRSSYCGDACGHFFPVFRVEIERNLGGVRSVVEGV